MVDDYWRLASGTALFADLEANDDRLFGMVLARPHPTGWFFSAHHRPDMPPDELAHFAEFAKVRVYLLLTQGPTATTWVPGPRRHEWIAWFFAERPDVAALVPDAVPANWS